MHFFTLYLVVIAALGASSAPADGYSHSTGAGSGAARSDSHESTSGHGTDVPRRPTAPTAPTAPTGDALAALTYQGMIVGSAAAGSSVASTEFHIDSSLRPPADDGTHRSSKSCWGKMFCRN